MLLRMRESPEQLVAPDQVRGRATGVSVEAGGCSAMLPLRMRKSAESAVSRPPCHLLSSLKRSENEGKHIGKIYTRAVQNGVVLDHRYPQHYHYIVVCFELQLFVD